MSWDNGCGGGSGVLLFASFWLVWRMDLLSGRLKISLGFVCMAFC